LKKSGSLIIKIFLSLLIAGEESKSWFGKTKVAFIETIYNFK